jgi:uncharacterized protein (DUF885 family)
MNWKAQIATTLGLCGIFGALADEPGLKSPAEFDAAYARLAKTNEPGSDSRRLKQLFELDWQYQLNESPETATYVGQSVGSRRWSDVSRGTIDRHRRELQRPLSVLKTIDRSALSNEERLQLDLFQRSVQEGVEASRFHDEWMTLNQLGGIQQDLPQVLQLMQTSKTSHFDDRVARLEAAGTLADQTIALLREGLANGVTPPQVTLRDVPKQVSALITSDPKDSALFRSFRDLPSSLPAAEAEEIRARALAAITNQMFPKLRELEKFLSTEYVPGARTNIACTSLPDGQAWYARRVRRYTTTDLTPQQIHEIGMSEVRRIRAEMESIRKKTGFQGDLPAFFVHLRTHPDFFYTRASELLAGYRDVAKRADEQLPRLFGKLPRLPYGVAPVPSYSERSQTTAYYQPGAGAFGRPGTFFANTYQLNSRPKWEMEALTLHEAVPGHHLQIALAQELEGVPEFQKHSETTAFVEGWGLYSESLGEEMGFYQDPYSKFGQLTYEMWRSIRLVVDTGMHALGWSREQAIQFFKDNAGKSEHDIVVEVDRYIVWPGQALAYKIGQLKIRELRALATAELGPKFDLRAFHDELLSRGAVPLDILEARMKEWIARRKAAPLGS